MFDPTFIYLGHIVVVAPLLACVAYTNMQGKILDQTMIRLLFAIAFGVVLYHGSMLREQQENFSSVDIVRQEIQRAVRENLTYEQFMFNLRDVSPDAVRMELVTPEFLIQAVTKFATNTLTDTWIQSKVY